MEEKRRVERLYDTILVDELDGEDRIFLAASSLSEGGMFLREGLGEPGQVKRLAFRLPNSAKEIQVHAEVLYASEDPWGVGVRFQDVSEEDQGIISGFIKYRTTRG